MDDTIRQARHRKRCEECAACKAPDCGKCEECVKKRKFGGKGNNKRPCVERRCLNLQVRFVGSRTSGSSSLLSQSNGSGAAVSTSTNSTSRRVSAAASRSRSRTKRDLPPIPFLLQEPSNKRVRLDRKLLEDVPPTHFCGLPLPPKLIGVCAMCGTDDGPSDQILLCDGIGCGREVHRSCSWPPLLEIPEGDFYCWYCTRKGSTEELQQYFLDHERVIDALVQGVRDDKEILPSTGVVDSLLDQDVGMDVSTASDTLGRAGKQTGTVPRRRVVYPLSELDSYHGTPEDSFVGKPLRLYTPHQCHTGRILQVRVKQEEYGADDYPRDTLCLVRFPAGREFRKTSFTTWLNLEEHAIEVATEMLWGVLTSSSLTSPSNSSPSNAAAGNASKKSYVVMDSLGTTATAPAPTQDTKKSSRSSIHKPLVPAQLWARTARELVKVVKVPHHPHLVHVRYRRKPAHKNDPSFAPNKRREWGLVQAFGSNKNEMIYLPRARLEEQRSMTSNGASTVGHADVTSQGRDMALLVSMMNIEKQSQERVRQWNQEFPLLQPLHPHALQLQDEETLGTLDFDQTCVKQSLIQPSPLIPQGLDRTYILESLMGSTNTISSRPAPDATNSPTQSLNVSKDTAVTLTCRLVEDTTGAIWRTSTYSSSASSC